MLVISIFNKHVFLLTAWTLNPYIYLFATTKTSEINEIKIRFSMKVPLMK